ncbi:MAG: DNA cytosine methyltransferase, partial [Nitrososphaerales archaeon]
IQKGNFSEPCLIRYLKVLDVGCGLGGWTWPFVQRGHYVVGIDSPRSNSTRREWDNRKLEEMIRKHYPGNLIFQDIRTLDGTRFRDFDLVMGSMPCRDFSSACQSNNVRPIRIPPDPLRGMALLREFERIVREAEPKLWFMENVRRALLWYRERPIWHFMVSLRGHRCLWGNLPIPPLVPEFRFSRNLEWDYSQMHFPERSALRAMIPYTVASFVCDLVEGALGVQPMAQPMVQPPELLAVKNTRGRIHRELQSARRKELRNRK